MRWTYFPLVFALPNILFIIADDLGWNDVGFHGANDVDTPTIDRLAREGVILNNYYVQPICTPTRAQIMTGRYAGRYGLNHHVIFPPQPNGLDLKEKLLSEYLKAQGYETHLVGKWHLGFYTANHLPTRRGFDSFFGYLNGQQDYYTKEVCTNCPKNDGRDLPEFNFTSCGTDFLFNEEPYPQARGVYSSDLYAKRVDDIVKQHDPSNPLFLLLASQQVHFPNQVPDELINHNITDPKRRVHSAMVSALDDLIAKVVTSFESKGLLDDTIIIFTTDNGGQTLFGSSNFPLRGRKDSLYQGGIRGTAFVNHPKFTDNERGTVSNVQMQSTDWMNTILVNYLGVSKVDGTDGEAVNVTGRMLYNIN